MAEFDASGFAAIDAILGGDTKDDALSQPQPLQQQPLVGSKRLGVGAAAPIKTKTNDLTQRLLKVGNKRKLQQQAEEEQDQALVSEHDEDDEEDVGRTAIDERKKPVPRPEAVADVGAKKKKKKGKKERQQQASKSDPSSSIKECSPTKEEAEAEAAAEEETAAEPTGRSNKRKRRKVRSRQKNIYKDHRSEKPQHLLPGHRHYQGRPLTAETRQKLNLPPKTQQQEQIWSRSGEWEEELQDVVHTMPLAVDSKVTVEEATLEKKQDVNKKVKKQSKKQKYKNL